jgi:putative transposase
VLQRKKKGSKNRRAARQTVAAWHRKVANQRLDFHHKLARKLVKTYDLIVFEDLKIKAMVRGPKPRPDPEHPGQFLPNGAGAKAGLDRSISDAGWAGFVSIVRAKAEEAEHVVIGIDPRHTSDGCEVCGFASPESRVSQAVFVCQRCGHAAHADEQAARNILRAGLALLSASGQLPVAA